MSLCDLCASIPLEGLPPFPEERYIKTLSGKPHFQCMVLKREYDEAPEPPKFQHHADLESLRHAAGAGCGLCRLIEAQVDAILGDIGSLDARRRDVYGLPPSFDLWLTKRPKGGQGFWAVTSCGGKRDDAIIPVATIGFCAEDGDPLAGVFHGRPVKDRPDSAILGQIVRWVADCDENHPCDQGPRPMPARLVDVGSLESVARPRLVELDEGTDGHYTTLSYCWGSSRPKFSPTRAMPETQTGEIDVENLPKAFQDAITLTRLLGVRYIWIDGLCIPQDDPENWERDSTRTGAVYANAYMTFSAAGARNSSEGLFFQRQPRTHLRVPHTSGDIHGSLLMYALPINKEVIRDYYVEMGSEPLSKRGWAFQERVLSRRTVHFASDQIYFECTNRFVSEDGLTLMERYHTTSPTMQISEEAGPQSDEPGKGKTDLRRWYQLLDSYGQRELTDPSDKLAAISGIARAYGDMLNDQYVAGLWRGSIIEGLCWQSLRCRPVDAYRAPSWSWAAVDGRTPSGLYINAWEPVAAVLDTHVELDGGNPFGRVKAAWIKMEAPLVPLSLSETNRGSTALIFLRTERGNEEGCRAGFDTIDMELAASAELVRAMKLFALLVAVSHRPFYDPESYGGGSCYHCIIVTPVDDGMEKIKRVGYLSMGSECFGPDEISSSRRVVTFV